MRHLGSLVLCLIVTPLVYLLTGIAGGKFVEAQINSTGTRHFTALVITLLAALAAGGLYGLLVLLRLSPVGTVIAGLGFLGITFWAMFDRTGFLSAMPSSVLGVRGAAGAAGPVTALLAVPLLLTVFSPRRWRRWGNAPAAVAPSPGYTPPPTVPSYSSSPYSYGSTEPSWPSDDPETTRRL